MRQFTKRRTWVFFLMFPASHQCIVFAIRECVYPTKTKAYKEIWKYKLESKIAYGSGYTNDIDDPWLKYNEANPKPKRDGTR